MNFISKLNSHSVVYGIFNGMFYKKKEMYQGN